MFNKLRKFLTGKKKKEWRDLEDKGKNNGEDIKDLKREMEDLKKSVVQLQGTVYDQQVGLVADVRKLRSEQDELRGVGRGYAQAQRGRGGF